MPRLQATGLPPYVAKVAWRTSAWPEGRLAAEAYGVVALGGFYSRRWTFYIDPEGQGRHVDENVNVSTAGQDIARTLETLGFPRAK